MVDKRVIIGGFGIGIATGTAILAISSAPHPIVPTETVGSAETPPTASKEPNFANADVITDAAMSALREAYQSSPSFESMVDAVAREQGGKISINQMTALAEIYGGLHGAPSHHDSRLGYPRLRNEGLSYDPYALLGRSQPSGTGGLATNRRANGNDDGYRGNSGARYQYDLSDPNDLIQYSFDVDAQLRDSIDPRVEIDRFAGQYGGGIERR